MVKMARDVFAVSVLMAAIVLLSGCGRLQINNTSGIREYLITQARCELLAVKIKSDFPNMNSAQYRKAEKLFNDAAAVGNGAMAEFIVKVKTTHVVDYTEDDFKKSETNKTMQAFLKLEDEFASQVNIKGVKEKLAVTPIGGLNIQLPTPSVQEMMEIAKAVQKRVDDQTAAGLNVINAEWFDRVYWNTFDKVGAESFNKKWQRIIQPNPLS